jgi:hypothetical protein
MKKISLLMMTLVVILVRSNSAGAAHIAQCDKVDIKALRSDLLEIVESTKFGAERPLYEKNIGSAEKACCVAIKSFQTGSSGDDKMFDDEQADVHGLLGNIFREPTAAINVKSALSQAQKTGEGFPFLSDCDGDVSHIKQLLNRMVHDKGDALKTADLNAALTPEEQKCAKSYVVQKQEGAHGPKDEQDIARLVGEIDSAYEAPEIHRFYGKSH